MRRSNPFLLQFYFSSRFYQFFGGAAALFIITWLADIPILWAQLYLGCLVLLTIIDAVFLFSAKRGLVGERSLPERLSIGDLNPVHIKLSNHYSTKLEVEVTEELPEQFQSRNNHFEQYLEPGETVDIQYKLRPLTRGDYHFGYLVCLVSTPLGFIRKRLLLGAPQSVKVYPSFVQMRQFDLIAKSAQMAEAGNKQMRKIGHSLEFEQIKEYVQGDDIRQLNWKATARKSGLMVNHYVDEKSQQVFCIIDKGRLMKMPFDGLSLLDYAINATLVLGSVSLRKQDRFGLVTFSHRTGSFLAADRKSTQLQSIMESLYQQTTEFLESDFEKLYLQVRTFIKQRSLLVLFTNFESMSGMKRQLPYLKQLARHHLLLVVFFENSELVALSEADASDLEAVYGKTIAWKFVFEKRMIVKELSQHGILSLLTSPQMLTVNTINRYLELKTRQAI